MINIGKDNFHQGKRNRYLRKKGGQQGNNSVAGPGGSSALAKVVIQRFIKCL